MENEIQFSYCDRYGMAYCTRYLSSNLNLFYLNLHWVICIDIDMKWFQEVTWATVWKCKVN